MGGEKTSAGDIASAWKTFISKAQITEVVRPEIAHSWQRCHQAGVDPFSGVSHLILSRDQLHALLTKKRNLIDIARPFMSNLYRFVKGSGFIVMLSDEQGYMMETIGDSETQEKASELNLIKGASWQERVVGTNGIGTALAMAKPIQVSGAEHYCKKVHSWTCSAAPIYDEIGGITGALQMSGPSCKTHQHTLGMVVAAVKAIEEQISIKQRNRELTLLNNRLNNIVLTVSDGIIVTGKEGVIEQVNPAAEKILGKKGPEITGSLIRDYLENAAKIEELLDLGKSYKEAELQVTAHNGSVPCLSSGKPIRDEHGSVSGAVIFINPLHKIKNLINRFSGAHATFSFKDIIGKNKQLLKAVDLATLAAGNNSHVLLQGESGTGKEVFAQAIHNHSGRRNGPFIAINCGAIPRELIGSELFGYEEGSFTGAHRGGRPGKFELASGGTLFLDEIGDMPIEHQVALLRVLQDKQVTRIGGNKVILVDVRIICATNKNLPLEVAKGNFRQDLFYRLNVMTITLPSLRNRQDDIPLLFQVFFREICQKNGIPVPQADPRVISTLQHYSWPGNIREFQNILERMINVAQGQEIGLEHLPEEIVSYRPPSGSAQEIMPPSPVDHLKNNKIKIKELLEENERQDMINRLLLYHGNVSQVAKEMGISRTSLYKRLKRLEISMK
ncbi:sigma-54-dependent Fis family transcriptional regulator [Candidatus Formimonas warabiya]|uniref:sigma-54-dependent Fis family transcriptional regulator n=1 Tax=Formimonas warabiya TaxID=1761012 RepID=UPI0011D14EA3|nr:sigma-54-dependent Fis family transcriptional regulator [Candidatus Formimonas warabiya]